MAKKSRSTPEPTLKTNESYNLEELSHAIGAETTFIIELVEHDLIEPEGNQIENWQFDIICYKKAKRARSFHHDLHINMPGIALALDLLDKIERLEQQLNRM